MQHTPSKKAEMKSSIENLNEIVSVYKASAIIHYDKQLNLINNMMTDFLEKKATHYSDCKKGLSFLHNITLLKEIKEKETKNYQHLLNNYIQFSDLANEKNKNFSCDFNVFNFFKINETTHSYLIAHLLDPNASHGQGNLFLKVFLELINIESPEKGQWTVTAEKGRIDILIKRPEPHSVVVIENKSNNAKDQENQLYRYWFQEIYYPNRHRGVDFSTKNRDKYQVIYLVPTSWKLPNDNTLSKPNEWPEYLPNKIPIKPKIIEFPTHVVEWLEKSRNLIPSTNNRLHEYIKQYIELWS